MWMRERDTLPIRQNKAINGDNILRSYSIKRRNENMEDGQDGNKETNNNKQVIITGEYVIW